MFPCPYANEHDCDEAFQSQVEASHHVILSHQVVPIHKTEDGQFICLHAEFGCSATFETTTLLTAHTQSEHRINGRCGHLYTDSYTYDASSVPIYSESSLPEGYQPAWRLRLSRSTLLAP